jgi:ribosome-associated protein
MTTDFAHRLVELAEDKQASEIILLDIQKVSTIADYFIICSADNDRQVQAIVDHIDEKINQEFKLNANREGEPQTGWMILDYGAVVIHVFRNDQRDYYRLDQLWNKAAPVIVVQ